MVTEQNPMDVTLVSNKNYVYKKGHFQEHKIETNLIWYIKDTFLNLLIDSRSCANERLANILISIRGKK